MKLFISAERSSSYMYLSKNADNLSQHRTPNSEDMIKIEDSLTIVDYHLGEDHEVIHKEVKIVQKVFQHDFRRIT